VALETDDRAAAGEHDREDDRRAERAAPAPSGMGDAHHRRSRDDITHDQFTAMCTSLIGSCRPPAGYAYDAKASSPQTVTPKRPSLSADCGPFLQEPTPALPRTRSTVVYSKSPLVPMGFQPPIVPRHAIFTSRNVPSCDLTRVTTTFVVAYVGSEKNT